MTIDFNWLANNFFHSPLTDDQQRLLNSKINAQQYDADTIIVEQGSMGNALYIIYSGKASIDAQANGDFVHIDSVSSGGMFGEMSFLTAEKVSATVTATQDCVIYELPRCEFSELMKEDQELSYKIFTHLLSHTADVIRHMNSEKAAVQRYITGSRF